MRSLPIVFSVLLILSLPAETAAQMPERAACLGMSCRATLSPARGPRTMPERFVAVREAFPTSAAIDRAMAGEGSNAGLDRLDDPNLDGFVIGGLMGAGVAVGLSLLLRLGDDWGDIGRNAVFGGALGASVGGALDAAQ